jgi:hypothetical protein
VDRTAHPIAARIAPVGLDARFVLECRRIRSFLLGVTALAAAP